MYTCSSNCSVDSKACHDVYHHISFFQECRHVVNENSFFDLWSVIFLIRIHNDA